MTDSQAARRALQPSPFPYQTSYWCAREPERLPAFQGVEQVDVVVVGGGFAGLSSARCLKEAAPGLDVVLLEAEHVGFGASGRNAGFVSPMPPVTWFADRLARPDRRAGVSWAVGYIREQTRALKTLVEEEGIDCSFEPAPLTAVARGRVQWNVLRWAAEQCGAVGIACRELSEGEFRATGYPGRAAIEMEGGRLHPYNLARGLLEVVRRRGVRVYEGTRIARVTPLSGGGVELATESGALFRARKVVLATNAYTSKLKLGRRRLFPLAVHTHMIATARLDDATLERLAWRAGCIGDISLEQCYLRVDDNRLLFGGGGKPFSRADAAADRDARAYDKLRAGMVRRFPFLADVPIESAWGGPTHETLTDAPVVRLADQSPDIVLNVGYASSGVLSTQYSGKMVAGLVLGEAHIDADAERLRRMFETSRLPVAELARLGLRFLWSR